MSEMKFTGAFAWSGFEIRIAAWPDLIGTVILGSSRPVLTVHHGDEAGDPLQSPKWVIRVLA